MDATGQAGDGRICPDCGRQNIPGAAFCAGCGRSLRDDAEREAVIDITQVDSQATSTFEPVASTVTAPEASPWARPDPLAGDPGQTAALPAYAPDIAPEPVPVAPAPRGMRGFWLGMVAVLLIVSVLAVYIYAAWLGDSARSTIDGWLPWT